MVRRDEEWFQPDGLRRKGAASGDRTGAGGEEAEMQKSEAGR